MTVFTDTPPIDVGLSGRLYFYVDRIQTCSRRASRRVHAWRRELMDIRTNQGIGFLEAHATQPAVDGRRGRGSNAVEHQPRLSRWISPGKTSVTMARLATWQGRHPHGLGRAENRGSRDRDLVVTADGSVRPIQWIGYRRCRRPANAGWDHAVKPVRIARGALKRDLPSCRSLCVAGASAVVERWIGEECRSHQRHIDHARSLY